jgi:hypothetical protein
MSVGFQLVGSRRQPKPRRYDAIVIAAWPSCKAAARQYHRNWLRLNEDRIILMSARLAECDLDPEPLTQAIHGAVAYWKSLFPDEDCTQYLTPETIYRPSKFLKYLEAYVDPRIGPAKRWEEMSADEQREIQRKSGLI